MIGSCSRITSEFGPPFLGEKLGVTSEQLLNPIAIPRRTGRGLGSRGGEKDMGVASCPGCGEDSKARELLKVHINRTRLKMKAIAEENYIQSVRGFRYRLSLPDD
jgi:hypothetical protein